MAVRAKHFRILVAVLLAMEVVKPCLVYGSTASLDVPVVREPSITQEQLEAFAEAQGHSTLSEHLDLDRPEQDQDMHLHRMLERAQAAWLNGSPETARGLFKDIAHLTLQADWRQPQREAIHYAHLRLAQSAPTGTEREEWIQKAIVAFPDLQPDSDVFPPPLMATFRSERTRLLQKAHLYEPFAHFPDHRFLLINGKKFQLTPDLKIRLPEGTYRVTALSDAYYPMTEKMTVSQLEAFRLANSPIAKGTCESPAPLETMNEIPTLAVLFAPDCVRVHSKQGWLPRNADFSENGRSLDDAMKSPAAFNLQNQMAKENQFGFGQSLETQQPMISKKTWLWIGVSVLVAGAAYVLVSQYNKNANQPDTHVTAVHHDGY